MLIQWTAHSVTMPAIFFGGAGGECINLQRISILKENSFRKKERNLWGVELTCDTSCSPCCGNLFHRCCNGGGRRRGISGNVTFDYVANNKKIFYLVNVKVVRFWKRTVAPAAIVGFSHRSNLKMLIFQRCCVLGKACFWLGSLFKEEMGLFLLLTKDVGLGLPPKGISTSAT